MHELYDQADVLQELYVAIHNNDRVRVVELLAYSDIEYSYRFTRRNLIGIACSKNQTEIVKLLIDKNANINIRHGNIPSCFEFAIWNDNIELVKYMLKAGVHITKGETVLMTAAQYASAPIVNILMGLDGVNINDTYENQTAIYYAIDNNNYKVISIFLDHPDFVYTNELFIHMIKYAQFAMIYIVIEHCKNAIDFNFNCNGQTALGYAVQHNNTDLVKLLLDNGANPNICGKYNLLQFAVFQQSHDIIRLLKQHGAIFIDPGNNAMFKVLYHNDWEILYTLSSDVDTNKKLKCRCINLCRLLKRYIC